MVGSAAPGTSRSVISQGALTAWPSIRPDLHIVNAGARGDRSRTFRPYELLWRSAPTWRNLQTSGMLLDAVLAGHLGRGGRSAQLMSASPPRKVGDDLRRQEEGSRVSADHHPPAGR